MKFLPLLLLFLSGCMTVHIDDASMKKLDDLLTRTSVENGFYQMGPDPNVPLKRYNESQSNEPHRQDP